MNQPDGFVCKYCGHVFHSEIRFDKHRCSKMDKHEKLHSLVGRTAHRYFNKWLKEKKRRECTLTTFGTSRFFISFYNFTIWKRKVKIPNIEQYIRLMVIWQFDPTVWTHDQVYTKYIEFIDKMSTVEDHIKNTWKTLKQVSNVVECDVCDVFDHLEPYMILDYIRARKLSPWVLLKIKPFKIKYRELPEQVRMQFNELIRPKFWSELMMTRAEETDIIVKFLEKVGL